MTLAHTGSVLGATLVVALLAGCATPADRAAMTPTLSLAAKQHPYSVSVATSGGAATDAMGSSNVSDADLKAALESAITSSKAFREIVQGRSGQYELVVRMISLNKPVFGLTFTVDMETGWTLTKLGDQQPVMQRVIRSSHTATTSDAFAGVTRLRLAVEGAVRANIQQGLTAVSALAL